MESDLRQEKVYQDYFLQELVDKYASRGSDTKRRIRQENVKVEHYQDRREEAEKALEDRLKRYLQITEVAIPEVRHGSCSVLPRY